MDKSRFRNTIVTMTDLIPQQRVPGLLQSRLAEAEIPLRSLGMRRGVPNPLAATRFFRIVRKIRPAYSANLDVSCGSARIAGW